MTGGTGKTNPSFSFPTACRRKEPRSTSWQTLEQLCLLVIPGPYLDAVQRALAMCLMYSSVSEKIEFGGHEHITFATEGDVGSPSLLKRR